MSQKLLFLSVALLVGVAACSQHSGNQKAERRATATDLAKHPPIGALGLPLGTYVEIHAIVVAQGGRREKAGRSYLLEVTSVGGRDLHRPVRLEFEKPSFVHAELAANPFDLFELKNGKEIGSLDETEIASLEQGYVGSQLNLAVFETGEFSGAPAGMPDVPWQDHEFTFSTRLFVVAQRP